MGLMRFSCLGLVVAAVLRCVSEGNTPLDPENPEILMATIHGFVTNGGSPINGADVSLSGPGIARTVSSGSSGFTFADLSPGTYTLVTVMAGFSCQSATVALEAGETVTASIACVERLDSIEHGTISGTVTAGGAPIPAVRIRLTSLAPERRVTADVDGTFTLDVPPGGYSVTAIAPYTACETAIVTVEVDQTVSADIVCRPEGGLAVRVRWADGSSIRDARVAVRGPVSREGQTTAQREVLFGNLPPGVYTVTATVHTACKSVTATIQMVQLADVEIVCEPPSERELQGGWLMYLPREDDFGLNTYSQAGSCPPVLPAEPASRSISFDSATGTMSIEGLDPDLTIAGNLHPGCENCVRGEVRRDFSGAGSVVRADGSSIRSELTGRFFFSSSAGFYFFHASMTRVHRDPEGDLVCTEKYWVEGNKPQ